MEVTGDIVSGNFLPRASSCLTLGESHLDPDRFRDDRPLYSLLALIVRLPEFASCRSLRALLNER